MKKILIIVAIVIVVGGGVGAYFIFFSNNKPKEEPKVVLYTYAVKDAFITNVKDSKKLFKTSIVLVVNKEKMEELFDKKVYVIRDTVLMILRGLTDENLQSMGIQDKLRDEISSKLNKTLEIDNIVSVYFGDFVMQ